jgi:hypothetical protein
LAGDVLVQAQAAATDAVNMTAPAK